MFRVLDAKLTTLALTSRRIVALGVIELRPKAQQLKTSDRLTGGAGHADLQGAMLLLSTWLKDSKA